ncbi:ORFY protein [Cacao swollen shoot CE virus]|uniref:ORFY protein n=1 Tax=Cacao swollen shoot CE virus TaxID=2056879 RepID=A0A2H4U926_9VIRU|nr:ORFY protein [Cacao swollen shoot CE virus]
MEPIPAGTQSRRVSEIPASQLGSSSYPYSLAYDGLLQQRHAILTTSSLPLSVDRQVAGQLYKLEEKAAKRALEALGDLQGIFHHKRAYLTASATRDNWAQDRLPTVRQGSENLDLYAAAIATIIEQVVQP